MRPSRILSLVSLLFVAATTAPLSAEAQELTAQQQKRVQELIKGINAFRPSNSSQVTFIAPEYKSEGKTYFRGQWFDLVPEENMPNGVDSDTIAQYMGYANANEMARNWGYMVPGTGDFDALVSGWGFSSEEEMVQAYGYETTELMLEGWGYGGYSKEAFAESQGYADGDIDALFANNGGKMNFLIGNGITPNYTGLTDAQQATFFKNYTEGNYTYDELTYLTGANSYDKPLFLNELGIPDVEFMNEMVGQMPEYGDFNNAMYESMAVALANDPTLASQVDFSNWDPSSMSWTTDGLPINALPLTWEQINLMPQYVNGDFSNMDVSGLTNLSSNFWGSNFTGANLSTSQLNSMAVTGANLTGANMTGVSLAGKNMQQTKLQNAQGLTATGLAQAGVLYGADLRGTGVTKTALTNALTAAGKNPNAWPYMVNTIQF